jgi:hypothetical protein
VREAGDLLDGPALTGYDLAVTFFSTTYLQTLRAGVPLVLYNPEPLNIVFPTIHHPLLRNAGTLEELAAIALRLRHSGSFLPNQHGAPIEHFIAFGDGVAGRILRAVETAEPPPRNEEAAPTPAGGEAAADRETLAERALREVERRAPGQPHWLCSARASPTSPASPCRFSPTRNG